MDALKLRMRAKDQLHPILQELVTSYARFKGSKDWEGRSKMVGWLITLNGMKASEVISDEQSRQVRPVPSAPVSLMWLYASYILFPVSVAALRHRTCLCGVLPELEQGGGILKLAVEYYTDGGEGTNGVKGTGRVKRKWTDTL